MRAFSEAQKMPLDDIMVDGGSVLQAFGLRRAGDTDVLWCVQQLTTPQQRANRRTAQFLPISAHLVRTRSYGGWDAV